MFPGKIIREKFLILRKKNWKQFRFFSKKSGFAAAKVEHFGENRIPRVQKNVSKRNTIFIWKFSNCFIVFTIRTKPYIAFGLSANSIGKVVKTAFQLSRWSYGEQDFSQKNVLLIIWLFHRRISNFRWIMYGKFVKNSFYVSRGSYLGEILWKKNFISNSGFSSITILTKLRRLVKTAFHISTWSFWGGIFFYLKVFEIIYRFRILNEKFWIFPTCS